MATRVDPLFVRSPCVSTNRYPPALAVHGDNVFQACVLN